MSKFRKNNTKKALLFTLAFAVIIASALAITLFTDWNPLGNLVGPSQEEPGKTAPENPQPDNTAYAYGQTAYQQAYQNEQSQPNAYQQAYYGQTQAKGTGTGFGIASLVLGILSVFTFACCINYILAVLAIIFGIVQIVKKEKKGLAIGGIITAVISIVLGIAVSLYAVNIAEKMQDPDSPFYQYFEEYEQKLEEGKSSF